MVTTTEGSAMTSERGCGTCTLCCKLMAVQALAKPAGSWCRACAPGKGCTTYDTRPSECRTFACLWLQTPGLPESYKPERSKLVMYYANNGEALGVQVDPAQPNAWRAPGVYEYLRRSAAEAERLRKHVFVSIGGRVLLLTASGEIDYGRLPADKPWAFGWRLERVADTARMVPFIDVAS